MRSLLTSFTFFTALFLAASTSRTHLKQIVNDKDVPNRESTIKMIIECATGIALNDFAVTVAGMSLDTHTDILAINSSIDMIKTKLTHVDFETIQEPILFNLLTEYTRKSIRYLIAKTDPQSDDLKSTAHAVKFLVYECSVLNVRIPPKQALKLIEFIYLYSEDCFRYQRAFAKLFGSFTHEFLPLLLDKFAEIFDPSVRKLIPLFCNKIKFPLELYKTFARYNKIIFEKITSSENAFRHDSVNAISIKIKTSDEIELEGDSNIKDSEFILNHLNILIASILNVTHNADYSEIQKDPEALNIVSDIVLSEYSISALPQQFFIQLGTLLSKIMCGDDEDLCDKVDLLINSLSEESYTKMVKVKETFNVYDIMMNRLQSLKYLKSTFLSLGQERLSELKRELRELGDFSPVLLHLEPNVNNNFDVILSELIIVSALEAVNSVLNLDRFDFLFAFFNYLVVSKVPSCKCKIPLILLYKFFNSHVSDPSIRRNTLPSLKNVLIGMFKQKVFLTTVDEYRVIYDYLMKMNGETLALDDLSHFIKLHLRKTPQLRMTIAIIRQLETKLQIHLRSVLIGHLCSEIDLYLKDSMKSIMYHDNGRLNLLINELLNLSIFSRTEIILLENFKSNHR